ncbi:MAG: 3-hydroxyacyl-CoA dehydrogenase NAD-binding domain-containing protein [Gemmatimonadales bacterium]
MYSSLTVTRDDGIAVVTLDLPGSPVNKISKTVRDEFAGLFAELGDDPSVKAIAFFSGKPDTFIAGADIDEFVALTGPAEAERLVTTGQELIESLPRLGKPIVVGIHGACVGGGLEFAMACQYRVATDHPKTQIGLPEVQLGIFPAAGGCQRLPRLIGLRAALDLILNGKIERAQKAHRLGIVDDLVHPALLRSVTLAAAKRMAGGGGWRPKRQWPGGLAALLLERNPLGRALVFRTAAKQVLEKTRGQYPAPLAAIEAIGTGLRRGHAAGLRKEAELFAQLAVSDVSRKLVQIFFATTALKKDFGIPNAPEPLEVKRLGVVGSGFMGSGIAGVAVAQAGADVRLRDTELGRVGKGLRAARDIVDERLKRRRITRYEYARQAAMLSGGTEYAGFGRADLVIEAVFEDLDVKRAVFHELEGAVGERCVLASNTSTLPITKIAEGSRRAESYIGMHFFSPVARMPLVEVILGKRTAPWVVSTTVAFGRRMGKTVIVVQDSPGFWVNRILAPYANELIHLLGQGASIEEIDEAAVHFGFPVGPVTLLDEVGLDVAEKVAAVMHAGFGERFAPGPMLGKLVGEGRLGRKSGRGFYQYQGGKKRGVDESVYQLIGVHANGGPRPAEITERLVHRMLNEAALALSEGVIREPMHGDVGAIFGFGFPPFRGGPFRYADDLGADRLVGSLERYAERYGSRFAPCDALRDMAKRGRRFYPK